jgi:hypothetical protein
MHTLSIDYRLGYRYAAEILDDRAARPVEVLVVGLPGWKRNTADNLITSAQERKAQGINPSYQNGVIARAAMDASQ